VAQKGEKIKCPVCQAHIDTNKDEVPSSVPDGYTAVLLSPQKQQFIGIQIGTVQKRSAHKTIRAAGKIAYDPDLYQAQAEYIQALNSLRSAQDNNNQQNLKWAQDLLESTKIKLTAMGLSEEMIDALQRQDKPDKSLLYAVADGDAWVYANIYEYEIPYVRIGQSLIVEIPSASGRRIDGYVRAIDKTVDPATRTVRIRASIKNDGLLKPDLYVNVFIEVDLGEALVVPLEAVFLTGKANIVFIDKGQGMFEPRHVVLGPETNDFYVIEEGLKEGERVVTNGNFMIDSESRLKSALGGMSGGHKHGN
jgi:Cu(I)/Ag(I) efflux system membrane fusion protein